MRLLACFAIFLFATAARAEEPAAPASAVDIDSITQSVIDRLRLQNEDQTPEEKRLITLYDDGFVLRGRDDLLRIGGWGQIDGRFFQGAHPSSNRALVRRARLDVRGVLEHHFQYRVYGDFAPTGTTRLVEGWLEYSRYGSLRVRVGQFLTPFSLEGSQSSLYTPMLERSMGAGNLWPGEDLGAMIFGKILGDRFEYAVGGFNGRFSTTSPRAAALDDNNDDFDIAGRLVAKFGPWAGTTLYLGGSATTGHEDDAWGTAGENFRTPIGTAFWTFAAGTTHAGRRTRHGVEAQILHGPFAVQGEYLGASYDDIFRAGTRTDLDVSDWNVQASFVLTGEDKPRSGAIRPRREFDLEKGGWGAVEIVGRYDRFEADAALLSRGFATGASEADGLGAGLHWWPNRHVMIGGDWFHTDFDRAVTVSGRSIDHEDVGVVRTQFVF